jgi:predicted transcriptional regulator
MNTISWILLSIGIGSQKAPIDFEGIKQIADGINHAIPTHQELQSSIKWLLQKGLITKNGKQYLLSDKGKDFVNDSQSSTRQVFKMWENLELRLQQFYKNLE